MTKDNHIFKFVEAFETSSDDVPKFDDHYCVDHIILI
jgi:hypothetical protein